MKRLSEMTPEQLAYLVFSEDTAPITVWLSGLVDILRDEAAKAHGAQCFKLENCLLQAIAALQKAYFCFLMKKGIYERQCFSGSTHGLWRALVFRREYEFYKDFLEILAKKIGGDANCGAPLALRTAAVHLGQSARVKQNHERYGAQ